MKVYTEQINMAWSPDVTDVQRIVEDHIDEYETEYDEYLESIEKKVQLTKRDLSDLEAELEDALIFEGDSVIEKLTLIEARYAKSLGYKVACISKGLYKIEYQS